MANSLPFAGDHPRSNLCEEPRHSGWWIMHEHLYVGVFVCVCLCVIKRHDHLGRCWRSFHIALPPWTRCAAVVVGVCGSLVVITLPSKRRGVSVDVKRSRAGHFR